MCRTAARIEGFVEIFEDGHLVPEGRRSTNGARIYPMNRLWPAEAGREDGLKSDLPHYLKAAVLSDVYKPGRFPR